MIRCGSMDIQARTLTLKDLKRLTYFIKNWKALLLTRKLCSWFKWLTGDRMTFRLTATLHLTLLFDGDHIFSRELKAVVAYSVELWPAEMDARISNRHNWSVFISNANPLSLFLSLCRRQFYSIGHNMSAIWRMEHSIHSFSGRKPAVTSRLNLWFWSNRVKLNLSVIGKVICVTGAVIWVMNKVHEPIKEPFSP